jgi:hypothetical protein
MTILSEKLSPTATNREVGFFPSDGALLNSDNYTYGQKLSPFMWIEGIFNATNLETPLLAVWDGTSYYDKPTNTVPLVTPVQFAYSGQQKPIRGQVIVSEGKDYRGTTITSAILDDGTAGFSSLIVNGGARPAA